MGIQPSPLATPVQSQGWFGRNWKWFVPTGCLTLIVLFMVFIGGILLLVFSGFKHSDVYKQAIAMAQKNPEVIKQLGEPVKPGWYFSGKIEVAGPSGHADIAIPISGPKNHGTLYAVADKSADQWKFTILKVGVEGRTRRIDLLKTDKTPPEVQEF
jgi:hypothetical protein